MIIIITGLIFLVASIVCLFFPHKLQEFTIQIYSSGSGLAKFNPYIEFIKTTKYILTLRIIGVLMFFLFAFMVYLLIIKGIKTSV